MCQAGRASSVSWAELYVQYRCWCAEEYLGAVTADVFGMGLDRLRAERLLRTRANGEDVFCLNVKLNKNG